MSDDRVLITLRLQAWARAKAELNCALQTFWRGNTRDSQFEGFNDAVEEFIYKVEDNGLQD